MSRMSDQDADVRLMASRCFANLVTLMPLEVRGMGNERVREGKVREGEREKNDRRRRRREKWRKSCFVVYT